MPGIFVTYQAAGPSEASRLGRRMLERLHEKPGDRSDYFEDRALGLAMGRVHLGFVNPAAQPIRSPDGSYLAVMDGEILDAARHRRLLEQRGCRFATDNQAELLIQGWCTERESFLRQIGGSFVAVLWDVPRRRLLVLNDRFGMKPAYVAVLPGKFILASRLKCVLADDAVSRNLSPRGLSQFFSFGQCLGEETLLEAIEVIPAACVGTFAFDDERWSLTRYAELGPRGDLAPASVPQWLDAVDGAFKSAVDRCLQGDHAYGISLSGGLDARTILGVIEPGSARLQALTMGMPGSIDHRSSERLSRLARCPHHASYLKADFLRDFESHLRRMVSLTDGQYLDQCVVLPSLPMYRQLGVEVLLRGHAGELLHMDKAYAFSLDESAFSLKSSAELEQWLRKHLSGYMLAAVDGPLFEPAIQEDFEHHVAESLHLAAERASHIDPLIHRIWHFFVMQRLRRETALSMMMFSSEVDIRLPYLDHDLVELLLAVPPKLKIGETLQAHILARRFPRFLDVPNSNTGTRLGASKLARRLATLKMKVLAKLGVPGYQPYERLGLWLRRELRPLVSKLVLSDRTLDRGIFESNTIRSVVEQHFAGTRNHTFLLMALMIFEQGQRTFLDRERDADDNGPDGDWSDRANRSDAPPMASIGQGG